MRLCTPLLGLAAAMCLAAAAAAQGKLADDTVVARVNGEAVTRKALAGHLYRYYGRPSLEQLVDRSLMEQEAVQRSVQVTDAEVAARAAELKKEAGAEYEPRLKAEGIDEEAFRSRVRYTLLAEKVMDRKWPIKDDDLTRLSLRYARVQSRPAAQEIIRDVRRRLDFNLLVVQRSLDKENGGLLQPNPSFRVDNPGMFALAYGLVKEGALREGQVTPEPIQTGRYWLVMKLERLYPPGSLKPEERQAVVRRIRAIRLAALPGALRREARLSNTASASASIESASPKADDELLKAGTDAITRKELDAYLFEFFGGRGLEQLAERVMVRQLAAKEAVAVSDSEMAARLAEVKRPAQVAGFQQALLAEGINEEAWLERVRYLAMAEKVALKRAPIAPQELVRLTARYVRLANRSDADEVLRAAGGTPFEQLVKQRSLDRELDSTGFVRPKAFLRPEKPEIFQAITAANLQPGQVLPQPVEIAGSYYVLRLESRLGPETIKPDERDSLLARINALRLTKLLDEWRKEVKVDYPVTMRALVADAKS